MLLKMNLSGLGSGDGELEPGNAIWSNKESVSESSSLSYGEVELRDLWIRAKYCDDCWMKLAKYG